MVGPPGCGKTHLARQLPSLLPPLNPDEALTITRIQSVAGQLEHPLTLLRRDLDVVQLRILSASGMLHHLAGAH